MLHEEPHRALSTEWFSWLADEIVVRFGEELFLDNGRLYEESGGGYSLVHGLRSRDPGAVGLRIPHDYPPLQLLVEHKVFIFDPTVPGQSPELEARLGGLESAAFLVDGEPGHIFAYGLRPGWQRDDLDFALNTLRNAIDLRVTVYGLQTDIEQAAEIQRSLLPETAPELTGFTLAARSIPATRVGGDFYDFLSSDPDEVVVAVGDASGHGLAAALLARDTVTGIRMGAERSLKATEIVRRLNRVIARSALSSRFVSLFYADLESNGNVFYVNAGHPAPWIVGDRGVRRLPVGGSILGPVEGQRFRRGWAHVDRGDVMVIATDGLLERMDAAGDMFEDARVEAILQDMHGQPASRILEKLLGDAKRHGGRKPWQDDTTVVVLSRAPTGT
jgi:sigma-B regulation protein RsbU (phosphoserine phosphatase)